MKGIPHKTGSQALTQPCQKLHAGIAVGGLDAGFALKVADCHHGIVAYAAVRAAGVKAKRGEALLDLLHLRERRCSLRAGEGLHESAAARHAIPEMHDRE